ncbi:hypothetical protein FA13DRAFT_1738562 [Coprinellus micaceus]|uniref:Uncharacterized protein n=1 Tax=Coprinellus micaceus TaxID=71717 RepID=A0A4Y7STG0_COPMI|nr:hypothetical protein FA13DRAFT_1738562 [Coprinellus micaceus]
MVQLRTGASSTSTNRARSTMPRRNVIGSDSDNGDWIDESEYDHWGARQGGGYAGASSRASSSVARASPHPSPRKRRRGTQNQSAQPSFAEPPQAGDQGTAGTRKEYPTRNVKEESSTPPLRHAVGPTRQRPHLIRSEDVLDNVITGIHHTSDYTFSILRPAIRLLRIPLSLILFLFLLSLILTRISSTLSSAFAPFCHVPGMSYTSMCRWVNALNDMPSRDRPVDTVHWADYPALVEVQSKTFEQMLDDSVLTSTTPSSLSLDLKKTEMATADLIALVRLSKLKSRDSLAETLSDFVQGARGAGRSLARLDAKMNGAMDSIMAMNDYALHAIEGARAKEPSKLAMALVPETFGDAMNVLSDHLARIILEVETNTQNLDALDEKLNTLRSIVSREDSSVSADREELLSYLWTKLGGNRKDLKNFNRNLKMLSDLGNYRKAAQARVVATLHTLERVSQDMEDMRERVAAPNLAGSTIAPEVHMKSIRKGLERLEEGRKRARSLEEEALRKALEASPS